MSLSVRITFAPTSLAVRSTVVIPMSSSSMMSWPSTRSDILICPTLGTVTVLAPLGRLNCSISANAGALCSIVYVAASIIVFEAFSRLPVVAVCAIYGLLLTSQCQFSCCAYRSFRPIPRTVEV